jgi:dTMP kinase
VTVRVGRFLTLEGIEGVGKSTQVGLLSKALSANRIEHVVTREPGGTPLAEQIRQLVLKAGGEAVPPAAELLLMFAARAVHLENLIEPNLKAGRWVLCDRFTDATYAYQGAGRGVDGRSIAQLETLVQGARQPDLTILLDLPVGLALARMQERGAAAGEGAAADRFEREKTEFFDRVRRGYLARAAAAPERIIVIDASRPEADVTRLILAAMLSKQWIF